MSEARLDLAIRDRLVFCSCLVVSFFVGPALGGAVQMWVDPFRAQNATALVDVLWYAAFLAAGAIAGNTIAGRAGRFPFLIAYAAVPIVVFVAVGQSLAFHDDIRWRPHEHILDVVLFNVAYPLMFAVMASIGVAIMTRSWRKARTAAAACAIRGVVGGIIFSGAVSLLPLGGYIEMVAFVASLGIPAFLSARPIYRLLRN
jgi:hypothetical protein